MRLYVTTTSERASKGQGGNEYLKIIVRNEKQQVISYITFKPNNYCQFDILKDIKTDYNQVEWIGTNDDAKTKHDYLACIWCGKSPTRGKHAQYCSEKCEGEVKGTNPMSKDKKGKKQKGGQ